MLEETNSAAARLRDFRGGLDAARGPVRERFNGMEGLSSSPRGADRLQLIRSAGRKLGRLLGSA